MEERKQRLLDLINKYENIDSGPHFYALAPGRVNIIGEHIDYCGYGVLPMAVQQNIMVAVFRNSSNKLKFYNTNSAFTCYSCNADEMVIDSRKPQWYHYIMCGIRGILEHFNMEVSIGMTLAVDGTVPPSAGLSSSSALVCASVLATLTANRLSLGKLESANIAASCEKYIGTEGGGMDQAISFLAQKGKAKYIEFNPLRETDVAIPSGAKFVIINSCVQINKASTTNYNERVVECRIATQILAKSAGLEWRKMRRLCDVQSALDASLTEMSKKVEETLKKKKYTQSEVCNLLEITADELKELCLSANTMDMQFFKLYQRAKHVYEEAQRVIHFKDTCDSSVEESLKILGKLMNESHNSLRDFYECSHADVDELVDICRRAGALGSRLTGAGWGGCTVSLVLESDVNTFIKEVEDKFFNINSVRKNCLDTAIFVSESASGAEVLEG